MMTNPNPSTSKEVLRGWVDIIEVGYPCCELMS